MIAAGQSNRGIKDQKVVLREVEKIGEIGQERISTFERLDTDDAKVVYLGESLKLHGDKFSERHPDYIVWMKSKGFTQESAISRFEEWKAEQDKNPFWSKPYSEKPKEKKRAHERRRRLAVRSSAEGKRRAKAKRKK